MTTSDDEKKKRFCLRRDDDSNWYLIPVELIRRFDKLSVDIDIDGSNEFFNEAFENMRISGPHDLTFAEPRCSDE